MTKKFDQVLSDDELDDLVFRYGSNRVPPARNLLKAIEQAVLAKLTEQQEPAAWLHEETGDVISSELKDDATEMLKGYDTPLYRCPCFSCKGNLDSSNHIPGDGHYYARDIYKDLGYVQWVSFKNLILRASQLIENGVAKGSIVETGRDVVIGSGAVRHIVDYRLDEESKELITLLAGAFKLNNHHIVRNETAILGMVKKWCESKGVSAEHQKEIEGFYVDLHVGGFICIEFDEPHHLYQKEKDEERSETLRSAGNIVLRFDLNSDAIDIINKIDAIIKMQQKMVVPDGWQLVPKTPTHNMVDSAHNCDSYFEVQDIYKAMLAAAPKYTGEK